MHAFWCLQIGDRSRHSLNSNGDPFFTRRFREEMWLKGSCWNVPSWNQDENKHGHQDLETFWYGHFLDRCDECKCTGRLRCFLNTWVANIMKARITCREPNREWWFTQTVQTSGCLDSRPLDCTNILHATASANPCKLENPSNSFRL